MRVLMLTRHYRNGQTAHVYSLCKQLKARGVSVILAAMGLQDPTYWQSLKTAGISCIGSFDQQLLEKLHSRCPFDIIHNHSSHTMALALSLRSNWKIPLVATCHYLDYPLDLLRQSDTIIVISQGMKLALSLPSDKVTVIENWAEPAPTAVAKKSKHLVIVLRVSPERRQGIQELVHTALDTGWTVELLGGPIDRIHRMGLTVRGWVSDTLPILATAAAVAGTGRGIRDGMACGCAALVLGHRFDGWVTPDNVSALRRNNFSGKSRDLPIANEFLQPALAISFQQLQELQRFSRSYAKKHFHHRQLTNEILKLYQQAGDPDSSV